ncbi:MAG: biotin synthase BioB [Gammaproteobacteria bacterium]|nr:biotin synthase BioB [Gammaproteobacteria bacterium]
MSDTTYRRIDEITTRLIAGGELSPEEGRWMIHLDDRYLSSLMAGADRLRQTFHGNAIEVCAISNVRSGNCSEDCGFCSQSGHHQGTTAPVYNYISADELARQAQQAREWGTGDFGIVSKGWGMRSGRERAQMGEYLQQLGEQSDIGRCASLGALNAETAVELKAMGLENYHHNLETAESFFDNICTTHTYQENIDTVRHAREAGLRVCSGGILGMGESEDQRVELAVTLRELGIESVPLNFLVPQDGTPLQGVVPLQPREILQTIAVFRFMLPRAEIRIAGGRMFLRDLQSMVFMAGASAIMIGDYLTTPGRSVDDDLQMLRDLNVNMRSDTHERRAREQQAAQSATA